jgi:hypothetical protein
MLTADLAAQSLKCWPRHTLCTYEYPAAIHEIVAWSESMRTSGRLLQVTNFQHFHESMDVVEYRLAVALRRPPPTEELPTSEVLYAVPIAAKLRPEVLSEALEAISSGVRLTTPLPRPWAKALHFGRIPTDGKLAILYDHWMDQVWRSAPCTHPICRVSHVCLAPNTGGGGA